MRRCLCHLWGFLLLNCATGVARSADLSPTNAFPVLTNAAQVRNLTAEQAGRKVPIRLRGVLVENQGGGLVIVDDTAGLYAEIPRALLTGMNRGDLIEAEGVSNPGGFAPFLSANRIRKLGPGQIPEPLKPDAEELLSGGMDAQWIEVSGVVRRVDPLHDGGRCEVNLDNGGGRILVSMGRRSLAVDATVRLRGVCYYLFSPKRQLLRPLLAIPESEPIQIIEAGPTDLLALPVRRMESLLQFSANQTYAHRVRVRGVVTHAQSGEGFWVSEPDKGMHILCDENELPEVGAEVDVFGFLKRGAYGPALEDAVFRRTGQVRFQSPVQLTNAAAALEHDSDLVACEAVILERWATPDGCRLRLSDGATEFPALLRETNAISRAPDWLPGTRVRVTGVCLIGLLTVPNRPGTWEPKSFQLLLRSPADVTILQRPPWWNAERVAWLSGGLAAVLLLVVAGVIWISRRRLRQEALERMKSEAEFAAVWNERNRMARELHDTLAQGLSAISMQLEVLKRHLAPGTKSRDLLEITRTLVREKMVEARNAIWNVRSQVLETGDLATALGDILRQLTEGTEMKGELRVRGQMRRLPPQAENNLLRIGQEAITNAVKYSGAQNLLVTLDFEERQLRLTVSDDGKGFEVSAPPPSEGGFGLKGMRERAAQMQAEFSITSERNEGTLVTLVLPRFG